MTTSDRINLVGRSSRSTRKCTKKTHGKTDQNWPLLYKKKHAKNTKLKPKHKAKPAGLVHTQEVLI